MERLQQSLSSSERVTVALFLSPRLADYIHRVIVSCGWCHHRHPPRSDVPISDRKQTDNKPQRICVSYSGCQETAAAETRRGLSLLWKHLIKTLFLPTCPTTFSFCSQRFASQTFVLLNYRPPDSNWGPGVPRLKSMSWGGPFNGLRCDYILESLI